MEVSTYLRLIRRWLWLIILAMLIAGSISFAVARTQPPRYQTSTTIQVGTYSTLANPDSGMISTSAQSTQTYAALIKTSSILDAVATKLQLPFSGGSLAGVFDVRLVTGTSLMTITVTYSDPVMAADIANELANQPISYSPTDSTKQAKDQIAVLENEITNIKDQLDTSRNELSTIDTALASQSVTGQDRAVLIARRSELLTEISTAQTNLASMSSTLANLQNMGTINSLRIVEPAQIPTNPINASPTNSAILGCVVGAALAFGVVLVIEYFNNSIRMPSEVVALLNVPLLGAISPLGRKGSTKNKLITWIDPRSVVSEAYRSIRVNLLFRDENEGDAPDCRFYVVTSSGPGEGKSFTTSNLAVTFAITGMRVLLIDADLRKPTQHLVFNLSKAFGLSDIWGKTDAEREQALFQPQEVGSRNGASINGKAPLASLIQKTEIPGLHIMTAGPGTATPAELLNTAHTKALMKEIVDSRIYDVVIIDTPPALVVSDTSIVANLTKGKVILVVESGRTSRPAAIRTVQQLQALSLTIAGVIMNRLKAQDRDTDYEYYYYGYKRNVQPEPEWSKNK